MNGLIAAPVDLHCSSKKGKITSGNGHYLKLLAICKFLSSNIGSISLLLFPANITHIMIQRIVWEKFSLLQRGSEAKCIRKLPRPAEMREDSYLAPFFSFYIAALSVNKIFPFCFCYIAFLAWSPMIPPIGAENPWKWKQTNVILST